MNRELELREQLANLQSKIRETQQELQEIEEGKSRNGLREFFAKFGHKYVKIDTEDGIEYIGIISDMVENEWGDYIEMTNIVKRWYRNSYENDFDMRSFYGLHYEDIVGEGLKIQVLTKDEYDSLVLNLLNKFLNKKVCYEN